MQFQFRNRRFSWSFTLRKAPTADGCNAGSQTILRGQKIVMWVVLSLMLVSRFCPVVQGQTPQAGSSSRQNRELAEKLIPYAQLNEDTRRKISEVVESASLYRRLPVNSIVSDGEYFRFLIRYPEVVVNIWQLMGVTQMTTDRTGPFTIDTNDGAGTISTLDLIYGNENLHVFYGTGTYEGPVLRRKLNGRCVLILRTDYRKDSLGNELVVNQMDVFLKLDNVGASLVAKTIQPIVGPTADQNFLDSLKFIQRLNETTIDNGPGVQHMAGRLNIDEDVRQGFIEVAGNVFAKNRSGSVNAQQSSFNAPTQLGNANQVGAVGYSFQTGGTSLAPGRMNSLRPSDNPIPAFQPLLRQPATNNRSDAFSRKP